MKTTIATVLFSFATAVLMAGGPVGARSAGMSHASLLIHDVWSVYNNQAGLASLKGAAFGAAFENRFFISALGNKSFAAAVATASGTFAVSAASFGYSRYSNNRLGLAYARKLGKQLDVGVQMDYLETRIGEGYGHKGAVTAEFGIIARPFEKLTFAAHVYNPMRTRLASYNDERVPTVMRMGGQYSFSRKVRWSLQLDKEINEPLNIRSGVEYDPAPRVQLRFGFATYTQSASFGFGYAWKNARFDAAATWQQLLGYSTQVSIGYAFARSTKRQ